jgi:hypothetical protein
VTVQTNVLGEKVFAFSESGPSGPFYNQKNISFTAGDLVRFDVADIDGSYSLVFGTEVDVSSTIQRQYFSQTGDIIVLSIPADYSGYSLKYFEDTSAGMGYVSTSTNPVFYVEISNNVFYIDGSANPNLTFTPDTTYVFDLSHNSNTGNTLVLGTIPDSSINLIDYQTVVGTPGQPGAYTTFTATSDTVYYYSFETPDMGYQPSYRIVSVSKYSFYPGETTTIRVKNATPYDGSYTITLTDISQSDLNNADLSGSIPKQAITDFTYSIPADVTNVGSFTYSIDDTDISATIQITEAPPIKIYTVEVSGGVYWLQQFDYIGAIGLKQAQPALPQFELGTQYEFHYTDSNHPIRLSTTVDGIHGSGVEYKTGVTKEEDSTDVNVTPYKLILLAEETVTLHYYCNIHSGYGDTGTSTIYKTYLDEMKIQYTFDISTNIVSGEEATIINSGTAGSSGDATLKDNGSTHTLSYSTDSKVGTYSMYNNTSSRVSGCILLPNVTLSTNNGFSYMFWVKMISSNTHAIWLSWLNGLKLEGYNMFVTETHVQIGRNGVDKAQFANTWKHVALTAKYGSSSSNYNTYLYIDGVLVGSQIDSTLWELQMLTNINSARLFYSGSEYNSLNGYIDDFRFYDQWLPDFEILRVYNETL